jgi:hypothetical protein
MKMNLNDERKSKSIRATNKVSGWDVRISVFFDLNITIATY